MNKDPMRIGNFNLIDNRNYIVITSYRLAKGNMEEASRMCKTSLRTYYRYIEEARSSYPSLMRHIRTQIKKGATAP